MWGGRRGLQKTVIACSRLDHPEPTCKEEEEKQDKEEEREGKEEKDDKENSC